MAPAQDAAAAAAAEAERAELEAATAADPGNDKLWGRFVAFELKGAGIEAARAVFERAAAAIPDPAMVESVYWNWNLKERDLGDVDSRRRVLERWVRRLPRGGGMLGKLGWKQYLQFEVHNGGVEHVRAVGEGLLAAHPMDPFAYVYYIRALGALSRHKEAFAMAKRGVEELAGWPGHDELIRVLMSKVYQEAQGEAEHPVGGGYAE